MGTDRRAVARGRAQNRGGGLLPSVGGGKQDIMKGGWEGTLLWKRGGERERQNSKPRGGKARNMGQGEEQNSSWQQKGHTVVLRHGAGWQTSREENLQDWEPGKNGGHEKGRGGVEGSTRIGVVRGRTERRGDIKGQDATDERKKFIGGMTSVLWQR